MKFTDEQQHFIKDNVKGLLASELTDLVNLKFNLSVTVKEIRAYKKKEKLTSGIQTTFRKGVAPTNPIKKGEHRGSATEFKKGHKPKNWMPVGSERINGDGYIDIKIAEPNRWKQKAHIIWEAANGPYNRRTHCLIFVDGNPLNLSLDNLALITRSQLAVLNKNRLINNNPEMTRAGVTLSELLISSSKKTRLLKKMKEHKL